MPSNSTPTQQLQINTSGAWRTIISFDDSKARQLHAVMKHGAALASLNPRATLRLASTDGSQRVSLAWSPERGWYDPETRLAYRPS